MRSDVVAASGAVTNGLFDFLTRELPPTQGRWISPDPAGLSSVDPSNPQSLNRYAYTLNNPLRLVDPTGNAPIEDACDEYCFGAEEFGGGGGGMDDFSSFAFGTPTFGDYGDQPIDISGWTGSAQSYFYSAEYNGPAPTAMDFENYNSQQFWGDKIYDLPGHDNPVAQALRKYIASIRTDPCVYLNNSGTGVESVDDNSSPGECGATGGQWIPPQPPGTIYSVTNGVASPVVPYSAGTFLHPSAAACGRINKKAKVDALLAGASATTGFLFPPAAIVTEPVAAGEGLFAVGEEAYMAFFCE
jgi:RHS repeat-associated protein